MTDYEWKDVNLATESFNSPPDFFFSFILIKNNSKCLEIFRLGNLSYPGVEHIDM